MKFRRLLGLSLKNLARYSRRTIITASAVAAGIMMFILVRKKCFLFLKSRKLSLHPEFLFLENLWYIRIHIQKTAPFRYMWLQ